MYVKMQESGFTEVIPLICTSAIWGQHPVFSILNPFRGHSQWGGWGLNGSNILCLLKWQVTFVRRDILCLPVKIGLPLPSPPKVREEMAKVTLLPAWSGFIPYSEGPLAWMPFWMRQFFWSWKIKRFLYAEIDPLLISWRLAESINRPPSHQMFVRRVVPFLNPFVRSQSRT